MAALALPVSEALVYAPIDFETESLRHGLDAAGCDWTKPTMFSWLGVTHYITADAIETTLHTIADTAPGSEVAMDYRADESVLDDNGKKFWGTFQSGSRRNPANLFRTNGPQPKLKASSHVAASK